LFFVILGGVLIFWLQSRSRHLRKSPAKCELDEIGDAKAEKAAMMVENAVPARAERELNDFAQVRNPLSAAMTAPVFVSRAQSVTRILHSADPQTRKIDTG
jgi:hypothetical protein